MIKKIFILIYCFYASNFFAFDWQQYVQKYPDLSSIKTWLQAYHHYIFTGMKENRESVDPIENTNFDWEFYVEHNQLLINNAHDALNHYKTIGKPLGLKFCKPLDIIFCFHVYHVHMIPGFVELINRFIKNNSYNNYSIVINVAIDENLAQKDNTLDQSDVQKIVLAYAPYHANLITESNASSLYAIMEYFNNELTIPQENIHFIFSENRGMDIGGFFMQLDCIFKKNLKHDYIIKLHTKTDSVWGSILWSFMYIRINKLLKNKKVVYSNKLTFTYEQKDLCTNKVKELLQEHKLPLLNFNFCGGTMFIAPKEFTDFFQSHDLLSLHKQLSYGKVKRDGEIEHAYERFFGYIFTYLNIPEQILGYYTKDNERDCYLD